MRRIARLRAAMEGMSDVGDLDLRALRKVKQAGFSDDQVAHYTNCLPDRCARGVFTSIRLVSRNDVSMHTGLVDIAYL